METLILTLVLLACPVGMGVMMWFMMRDKQAGSAHSGARSESVADLREEQRRIAAEIDRLKEVRVEPEASSTDRPRPEVA